MKASNGEEYRNDDKYATHWGKYDSAFHAWLVETCEPDDYTGDIDYGGIVKYGKRLDEWTSTGFHSLATYKTEEEAQAAYDEWAEEYDKPEVERVDSAREIRDIVRRDRVELPAIEDVAYSHPGYRGVALRIYAPVIMASYYRGDEVEYEAVADSSEVWVYMVGDDSLYLVDRQDLTRLDDDEFCGGCGQIGCGHTNGGDDAS